MNRIAAALLALVCLCLPVPAATLLPPGQQTFLDNNGKPLNGGTVAFYYPGTTTTKQTWQDAGQATLNTNPVQLDTAGRATIYGAGAYRQIVRDGLGNLIWDRVTADTSSSQIAWGGTSTGAANAQVVSATNFTSADGQIVGFIAGFTNTGQLSVSANSSGPIPVLADTLSGSVNLSGQEVQAGAAVLLVYDASRGAFHLIGGQGGGGAGFGTLQALPAANIVDLGLVNTHNVIITGSATITSFGSSASLTAPVYQVTFAASGLVQGSASLATPQGPLYVSAGDSLTAIYSGPGQWRVVAYQSAHGFGAPAGMVGAFSMATCPAGWNNADGSPISRSTYAGLFAQIGTIYGAGDGASTFNTPDLRGYFLRGVDNGAGRDAGRALGTAQSDAVGPHQHTFPVSSAAIGGSAATIQYPNVNGTAPFPVAGQTPVPGETRPVNVSVLYCIKY